MMGGSLPVAQTICSTRLLTGAGMVLTVRLQPGYHPDDDFLSMSMPDHIGGMHNC